MISKQQKKRQSVVTGARTTTRTTRGRGQGQGTKATKQGQQQRRPTRTTTTTTNEDSGKETRISSNWDAEDFDSLDSGVHKTQGVMF